MFRCTLFVLTNSVFHNKFQQKKCIHICVPSYFIDIVVYIIFYVNVHFCLYKSAKIELNILL